jgi:drug/metabolite transporter (DMT)-like permease
MFCKLVDQRSEIQRLKQALPLSVVATALLAVVLWGSAPVALRVALAGYGPGQLAFLRFGLASVVLAIYGIFAGLRRPQIADLPALALSGAIGITLYNVVLNYGLQTVPAAAASFLVGSTPIWTSLLAVLFLNERLTWMGWAGILVSFAGIGLIARERGHGLHFSPGAILIGLNAIAYGVYMILQKRLLGRLPALEFTTYSFWAGSLLLLPFGGGSWSALRSAAPRVTWALFYLGVFPAALANVAWALAMARVPASRISSFFYLMPVATVVIAWCWLGEVPTLFVWIGGALALAGVVLVNVCGHAAATKIELTPTVLDRSLEV